MNQVGRVLQMKQIYKWVRILRPLRERENTRINNGQEVLNVNKKLKLMEHAWYNIVIYIFETFHCAM